MKNHAITRSVQLDRRAPAPANDLIVAVPSPAPPPRQVLRASWSLATPPGQRLRQRFRLVTEPAE